MIPCLKRPLSKWPKRDTCNVLLILVSSLLYFLLKYFSSDTDNKQKKYPTEFEKYMTKTVIAKITSKKYEKSILTVEDVLEEIPITKPRPTTDDSNLRKNANGEQVADIPIKLNRYFWSETLKASVKLVGFSNNLLAFQIDQRILMPLNNVESLKLIPYSGDYFIYTTRRTPPEAEGKTMAVFPRPGD